MNNEVRCYIGVDIVSEYIDKERETIVNKNKTTCSERKYVEEYMFISYNSWLVIKKTNVISNTAIHKILKNEGLKRYLIGLGVIQEISKDLF